MNTEPIQLHIHGDGDFMIPVELLESNLDCAEVLALALFLAFYSNESVRDDHTVQSRMASTEFKDASKRLQERGILKVSFDAAKSALDVKVDIERAGSFPRH